MGREQPEETTQGEETSENTSDSQHKKQNDRSWYILLAVGFVSFLGVLGNFSEFTGFTLRELLNPDNGSPTVVAAVTQPGPTQPLPSATEPVTATPAITSTEQPSATISTPTLTLTLTEQPSATISTPTLTQTPTTIPTRTSTASSTATPITPTAETTRAGMVRVDDFYIDRSPWAASSTYSAALDECARRGMRLPSGDEWYRASAAFPQRFNQALNVEEWTQDIGGVDGEGNTLYFILTKGELSTRLAPDVSPENEDDPPRFRCVEDDD